MINITFPDQSVRQYEAGVTPLDIAKSLSEGLARNVLVAKVNGMKWDAMRPINEDATIQLFTWDDPEGRQGCLLALVGPPHGRGHRGIV